MMVLQTSQRKSGDTGGSACAFQRKFLELSKLQEEVSFGCFASFGSSSVWAGTVTAAAPLAIKQGVLLTHERVVERP